MSSGLGGATVTPQLVTMQQSVKLHILCWQQLDHIGAYTPCTGSMRDILTTIGATAVLIDSCAHCAYTVHTLCC